MLHVAVLITTSSELGGPGVRLPMDALAEAKASIAVASSSSSTSDSEGEVAHRSYHFCGQQMQEFHCSAPEHVSLDWLVDPMTDNVTGDAAHCFSKGSAGMAAATAATVAALGTRSTVCSHNSSHWAEWPTLGSRSTACSHNSSHRITSS